VAYAAGALLAVERVRVWSLVLTHGFGSVRCARTPDDAERNGYVPNIVYSCGGLVHAGRLWLPYGMSDARVGFAAIALATLLDALLYRP
jgi:hypothetical protein